MAVVKWDRKVIIKGMLPINQPDRLHLLTDTLADLNSVSLIAVNLFIGTIVGSFLLFIVFLSSVCI
ncbi:MAG: hypothetical protein PHO37_04420 [Kiritimatiellae bacterium]|nr:hypothetical protein [Kiritimatiellia bacterium]